jgi:hypothetical protein
MSTPKHRAPATAETIAAERDAYTAGPWTTRLSIITRVLSGRARHRAGNFTTREAEAA